MKIQMSVILLSIVLFIVQCKDKPTEIEEGTVTTEDGKKINALTFSSKKGLINFYNALRDNNFNSVNKHNQQVYYTEFSTLNNNWYSDTIYVRCEESECTSLDNSKFTEVFLTFYNKQGVDILKKSNESYKSIIEYFNDIYLITVK